MSIMCGVGALMLLAAAGCEPREADRAGTLRIATYNTHLAGQAPGALIAELEAGSEQIDALVTVIASVDPDVLILQEIDHDPEGRALALFAGHLVDAGLQYAERFSAPVNTGVPTRLDLDGDGKSFGPGDAQGWGLFEGQFGMAVLSRLPILRTELRTFRELLWADMPGNLMPVDALSPEAPEVLRLSSKSHWDIPLRFGESGRLHLLISHPTPPVFDGPEDRNGRRNHDEIRFWIDYLDGAGWIRDDLGGAAGVRPDARVVIAGDLNSDPEDGDGRRAAIRALLEHPSLRDVRPRGTRDPDRAGLNAAQNGDPALDTANWRDTGKDASGDLRVDYLIPSQALRIGDSGVVWPGAAEPLAVAAERASDHRLVWIDIEM